MPQAPIAVWSTLGSAATQAKISRTSWISRGPSTETKPSDWPWPRMSTVRTTKLEAKRLAIASRSCRLPPRPWNMITAGCVPGASGL